MQCVAHRLTVMLLLAFAALTACSGNDNAATVPNDLPTAVPPPAAAVAFPLRSDSGSRHLVDAAGSPFIVRGRAAWKVLSLSVADYTRFLDDTKTNGFNVVEVEAIWRADTSNAPFAGNGSAPFRLRLDGSGWNGTLTYTSIATQAADFTTPNEAYWAHVDAFIDACADRGIAVMLFPAYVGYKGGPKGWMQEMVANGAGRLQTYGAWVAQRYRNRSNLIWMIGGDYGGYTAAERPVEQALIDGLKGVAGQSSTVYSSLWDSNTIGTDQPDFGGQVNLNGAYSWNGQVASQSRRAYARTPVIPAFMVEGPYDEEGPDGNAVNPSATQPVRRFAYWGWLGTIGGYVSGNGYVWTFKPGWATHLDTAGTRDLKRLHELMASMEPWRLIPQGLAGTGTLVTGGAGLMDAPDYVAAAATSAGDLLVAYVGPGHAGPITVDLTRMRGTVSARWFDPTSGNYRLIGSFPNAGSQTFTPPTSNSAGGRDWILRLDA